ncbi:hypothetical protein DC915_RS03270 [Vibrio parahaemolyticus]|uniref:Uncharacterized protein n=2 Tax=Vibrio harveyi group TaxID=717610 RepID=A0A9Q3UAV9_VIBPH|nr:hypothetical protein [Vibrio parahaemolyticus]ELA8176470.1 hypothetical protein [Vibrio alginolyticus]CAH1592727.1 hypothetical protein THF1C08_320047 [Vibrio jasicida]EJC7176265.1 hypothetical protein [Vibrio parahaemolyticus]EJE4724714.1 hypothetical protein [Vibrio parahaemolyticus]EJG0010000.1 hypothetical protein [Vibrio parahaemolyticus]
MAVSDMTHDEIADWCSNRLTRMGYRFAFSNMTSNTHGEQPDVLGVTCEGYSIVVEVKTSRSDFKADLKKVWRINPEMGMGDERVYLAPEGLLEISEIPYGWQLWEVYGKNQPRLRILKGREKKPIRDGSFTRTRIIDHNIDVDELFHFARRKKSYQRELTWMMKILTRAQESGIDLNQFSNNYQ